MTLAYYIQITVYRKERKTGPRGRAAAAGRGTLPVVTGSNLIWWSAQEKGGASCHLLGAGLFCDWVGPRAGRKRKETGLGIRRPPVPPVRRETSCCKLFNSTYFSISFSTISKENHRFVLDRENIRPIWKRGDVMNTPAA